MPSSSEAIGQNKAPSSSEAIGQSDNPSSSEAIGQSKTPSSSGCEAQPEAEPAGQENPTPRDIQSAVYAAAGARDWARVESLLHPDFVLYEAECLPFGGEWRGRDALQRCAEAMYGTWKEAKVDIHDITGGDTHAVTVLTLTMTPKGGGAPFSQTVCETGEFEGGLMKSLRIHYFDAGEVARRAAS